MQSGSASRLVRFGPFELDVRTGELKKNGIRIRVPEQSFQVLVTLLEHPGDVVTRDELHRRLWPNGTVVEFEHGVNAAVKRLRAALADSADSPRYIETLPRRGYRFIYPLPASEPQSPSAEHTPGAQDDGADLVSHFRLIEKAGQGGMGIVFKAVDLNLERVVALKFLPEEFVDDDAAINRFKREARAASQLNHPNICTIFEFGNENGRPFIAMEWLDGRTLAQRLREDPVSFDELIDIGVQVANGLDAAHGIGILHRDIKPGNLFLTDRGQVKILDFGVAKRLGAAKSELTKSGAAVGTAGYMSPEQARGEHLDVRSDLYSLGLVLQEMVRGLEKIPAGFQNVIRNATDVERERRYPSVAHFRDDLERLMRSSVPLRRKENFSRALVLLFGFVVILAIILTGGYQLFHRSSPPFQRFRVTRLTTTGNAQAIAVSPDGKYAAYVLSEGDLNSIWLKQVASGDTVQIRALEGDGKYVIPPAFSPDGSYVYYKKALGTAAALYAIPVVGGTPRRVLDIDEWRSFDICPDGKRIAFVRSISGDELVVANLDGSGERIVARRKLPGLIQVSPAWSPDGMLIAFAVTSSPEMEGTHLSVVSPYGGPETRIATGQFKMIGSIDWTPAGHGLIISASDRWVPTPQLWYQPYPSGKPYRITQDASSYFGVNVTSDGNAFITILANSVNQIWFAQGSKPGDARQIGRGILPTWTRDRKIL
jgi:eukaryotic-like serine/threonine-protein kinase